LNFALKAPNMTAQGNALGPERAEQNHSPSLTV
jgi:hypothetical protein